MNLVADLVSDCQKDLTIADLKKYSKTSLEWDLKCCNLRNQDSRASFETKAKPEMKDPSGMIPYQDHSPGKGEPNWD